MRKDGKGHEIKTFEGFTGYVNPDIKKYFEEKYSKASFKVVPGHWPSMETEKDVDEWLEKMEKLTKIFAEERAKGLT